MSNFLYNIFSRFKKSITIDYSDLDQEDRRWIANVFLNQCIRRIKWVSAVAFIGETILMGLDIASGFFEESNINFLNLAAEIIIIVSSLFYFLKSGKHLQNPETDKKSKVLLLTCYKFLLFISVGIFMFTDIYVRHKPIGPFIVFLFIFQIIPFYKPHKNLLLYLIYGALITFSYLKFVPDATTNTLFTTFFIYIAFFLSTECLRQFFIKNLINSRKNLVASERFENLAAQSILALSNAVEAKDLYTKGHSQRVANYSREIAKRMGMPETKQDEVYYIGLLHDIGKIGVRDTVINKKGRLDDDEYAEIKKHPEMGYDILKNITEISDISLGAKWHHERYDGKGYPDGLAGNDIPLIARIIAVADSYDAMTSTRSYRDVMPQDQVRNEIEKNIGKQFAPETAKIMLQMIDEDTEYTMHE